MTKSKLTEILSEELGFYFTTGSSIVNTILNAMSEALAKGDNIEIRGFGTFTVRHYNSYAGRNPKTGEEIITKPKKLPFFKVGKSLKEAVNSGKK